MTRAIKHHMKAKRKSKGSKKGEGCSSSSMPPQPPVKVWQPSAYNSLHAFHIGWPRHSFDILRDTLDLIWTEFPYTVYFMAGTQAEKSSWNSIRIFKVSNISGKRHELVPKLETDEDVIHEGCINLIRSMAQNSHICAAQADTGYVQVWDFSSCLNALAESETEGVQGAAAVFNQDPLYKYKHKDEGYAIDWSPLVPGRLYLGIARIVFICGSQRLLHHLLHHRMLTVLLLLDIQLV